MKWLLIFAHPDDETVAAGGTIQLLRQAGHQIKIITVTAGQAGEIDSSQAEALVKAGSVTSLRLKEFAAACQTLGVKDFDNWDYKDGQITNEIVWGKLTLDCIDLIDTYQPDAIVTFDHSGWYYHLDHIGVSIAVTRAWNQAAHQEVIKMFNLLHPPGIKTKWPYVYPQDLPHTHSVNITSVIDAKIQALKAHASQKIGLIEHLKAGKMDHEYFQILGKDSSNLPDIFDEV